MTNIRKIINMHTPTVPELVAWLQSHDSFHYMGPMDLGPTRVRVVSKVKTWANLNRFAVTIKAPLLRFRVDEGHLNRIYLPDPLPVPDPGICRLGDKDLTSDG
jgi:hypothetical protein